ncbi:alpha-(1,6)-fucosyltransferase [Planococcus citri]|uniref:alpha-(1,6)-fucosyltransferase n=1 Tax=Planococcus citri TaxID=170843 RepID=UPI0031F9D029
MTETMKVFRQIGWCRYLFLLSIIWFIFALIFISFLRHEPDINTSDRISEAMRKLNLLQRRESEMMNLLTEFSHGLQENDRDKFLKRLNHISKNHNIQSEPFLKYETLRRRLYHNVHELWYYINFQTSQFTKELKKSPSKKRLTSFMNMIGEFKRSIVKDINDLEEVDGYKEWRLNENEELSNLVQRRLHYLQNPKDCKTAKKLVCDLNKGCGYGCQLHHLVYCFIVAYGTERTLIVKSRGWRYSPPGWEKVFLPVSNTCTTADGVTHSAWPGHPNTQVVSLPIIDSLSPRPPYLPLSIPEDLSARIIRIHGDPIVWWVGQFLKYLLRPQSNIKRMLSEYEEKLGFKKPIVGVHIRRTDKVGTEAAFHALDEYMTEVEEYYRSLQMTQSVSVKRVYIATDDPKVFEEAKLKYTDYEIIGDAKISKSAAVNNRYSENSLSGIITDIHLLSLTDYLVCTFSSQVCRVAYEIMNNIHFDAAQRYRSLDDIYYYGGQKARCQVVVIPHRATRPEEIDLKVGDILTVAGNHWDGYSKGTNTRTFKTGLYPTFKVIPKVETASFPTYPQVPIEPNEL